MDKRENGQVLLIVVLVMIVALTVGLSLASRSITNQRASSDEVASQKSLAAAEAGIEQSVQTETGVSSSFSNDSNVSFTTGVTKVGNTLKPFLLSGGNVVPQDEGVDLWLAEYSTDPNLIYSNPWSGNLTIYWGDNNADCASSALEVMIVYGSKSSPQSIKVNRYAFESCSARAASNNFTYAGQSQNSISGKTLYYAATINNISSGLIARIIPLYSNAVVGVVGVPVNGGTPLPVQGVMIQSLGKDGTTQREVDLYKGYSELSVQNFSYGLFAP